MLSISTIRAGDLTAGQVACWARLQEQDPQVVTPTIRPRSSLCFKAAISAPKRLDELEKHGTRCCLAKS